MVDVFGPGLSYRGQSPVKKDLPEVDVSGTTTPRDFPSGNAGDVYSTVSGASRSGHADSARIVMKRMQEQAEQARQQGEEQKPQSFISASGPTTTREMEESTEPTWVQATTASFRNIGRTGTIGTQGTGKYFGDIFEPFSRIRVGESNVPGETGLQPFLAGSGTIVNQTFIGARAGYSTEGLSMPEIIGRERIGAGETIEQSGMTPAAYATSVGEKITGDLNVKAQDEFEAEIAPIQVEYQYKIDEGFMAYNDAVSLFGADTRIEGIKGRISDKYGNIAQTDFDTSFNDFTTKRGISERRVATIKNDFDISSELKTGVLTAGILALSTTPVGLATVTGYSLGMGSKDIQQGVSQKDWMQVGFGVAEIGLGLYGAEQIGYKKTKLRFAEQDIELDLNIFGRQDIKEKFKALEFEKGYQKSLAPPKMVDDFLEVNLIGSKGGLEKMGIQEDWLVNAKAFQIGDDSVSAFGKGGRTITFITIEGDIIKTPTERFMSVSPKFPVIESGASVSKGGFKTIFQEGFTAGAGKSMITPSSLKHYEERFFVVTQETPSGFYSKGGKPSKVFFKKGVDVGIPEYTLVDEGGSLALGSFKWDIEPTLRQAKVTGKPTTFTFIEKPAMDEGIFKITKIGGKRSKAMKPFGMELLQQQQTKLITAFAGIKTPKSDYKQIMKDLSIPKSYSYSAGSIYAGKGTYELTSGGMMPGINKLSLMPIYDTSYNTRLKQKPKDIYSTTSVSDLDLGRTHERLFSVPVYKPDYVFKPSDRVITSLIQSPGLKTKLAYGMPSITPSSYAPSFDFSFDIPKTPKGFFFALPNLGYLDFPKGRAKGKRTYERTPTLFALEFGLKDYKPSSLEVTGLVRRPILTSRRRKKRR